MVRALQDDCAGPGGTGRGIRRQNESGETQHRRQSGDAAEIRHSQHPDPDDFQGRRSGGDACRRGIKIATGGLYRKQPRELIFRRAPPGAVFRYTPPVPFESGFHGGREPGKEMPGARARIPQSFSNLPRIFIPALP
ncbi:MAG: hypothetical protein IBGAMO2_110034 [Arenicellales bacterium IbO2]|nr:MAG: hypothetical protein IBGAMO2_110034 [Arenicellales bacterium IbO2]